MMTETSATHGGADRLQNLPSASQPGCRGGEAEPVQKQVEPFTFLYLDGLTELVRNTSSDMTKAELRILLFLIAEGGYRNQVTRYVDDVAAELDMNRSTVSKALSRLDELDLITRQRDPRGGASTWKVCPGLAFRGRAHHRAVSWRKWRRDRANRPAA